MQTTVNKLLNSIAIDNNDVQNALGNDNEVIQCACVRGGHLKWKYEDWVQHSKPGVRKLIAETYPEKSSSQKSTQLKITIQKSSHYN